MSTRGALQRWRLRDPDLAVTRRGLRVAVAASTGLFVCRYGFDDPTAAVYATFGAVGFGLLSELTGGPGERVRTLVPCLAAGVVLVALGTLAAADTLLAALGMLVIGPLVAFLSIGGPRTAGVAPGLQLLYILPSFPPYAPDTLTSRWAGLALGLTLLAVAEGLLWPARPPRAFASRLVAASHALAAHLRAVVAATDDLAARRAETSRLIEDVRVPTLPWAERPTGPSARDRGLARTALALRSLHGRILALEGRPPDPFVAAVGRTVADSLDAVADALAGTGALPTDAGLDATREELDRRRRARIAGTVEPLDVRVDHAGTAIVLVQLLEEQRVLRRAAGGLVSPLPPVRGRTPVDGTFWWADATTAARWWWRVRRDLSPRSVHLQNALRLGAGLAVARLVAGELDLSHGFWVLLATLTLMRTSVTATRAGLLSAVAGTAAGAVVAAAMLSVVGPHHVVYVVLLPLLVVGATLAGRLVGVVAGQACFTVLVSALFAQLAPAGWTLAGVRLLDVAVGALVGLGVGALVWPRGAGGEVSRDAAAALDAAADVVVAVVAWLGGAPRPGDLEGPVRRTEHLQAYFESSVAQLTTERRTRHGADVDWPAVLAVVHRTVRGARAALAAHPDVLTARPPGQDLLRAGAERVAEDHRAVARSLRDPSRPRPEVAPPPFREGLAVLADVPERREHPEIVLRQADAWGWLAWLAADLAVLDRAVPVTGDAAPGARTDDQTTMDR